ncbi:unnamed protein product [Polarella glacialis]|uniref:Uncharacterized protein n=1 Tax=Polarella glacialis TaxID=89957 RepID=A0A813F833_POLGL|nr:unnamed protein product [Polarella glacialis]
MAPLVAIGRRAPRDVHALFQLSCLPCASPAWAEHDGNQVHDDDETPTYNGPGFGCCSDSDKGSMGSLGHPYTCAEACKYSTKGPGCKEGAACDRCHLCEWKRNDRKLSGDEPILSKWTGGSGGQGGTTPARPSAQGTKNFPVIGGFLTVFPTTVIGGSRGVASLEVLVPAAASSDYPAYTRSGRTRRRAGANRSLPQASGGTADWYASTRRGEKRKASLRKGEAAQK